ncbi:MAG: hypothetical protein KatS3mg085_128 [Candidatus Dojkabacteria bacterium]|nr:MAG: hypothetical protein KatS3mg085_128 [Candidatus Dojkabacteria bacterium]
MSRGNPERNGSYEKPPKINQIQDKEQLSFVIHRLIHLFQNLGSLQETVNIKEQVNYFNKILTTENLRKIFGEVLSYDPSDFAQTQTEKSPVFENISQLLNHLRLNYHLLKNFIRADNPFFTYLGLLEISAQKDETNVKEASQTLPNNVIHFPTPGLTSNPSNQNEEQSGSTVSETQNDYRFDLNKLIIFISNQDNPDPENIAKLLRSLSEILSTKIMDINQMKRIGELAQIFISRSNLKSEIIIPEKPKNTIENEEIVNAAKYLLEKPDSKFGKQEKILALNALSNNLTKFLKNTQKEDIETNFFTNYILNTIINIYLSSDDDNRKIIENIINSFSKVRNNDEIQAYWESIKKIFDSKIATNFFEILATIEIEIKKLYEEDMNNEDFENLLSKLDEDKKLIIIMIIKDFLRFYFKSKHNRLHNYFKVIFKQIFQLRTEIEITDSDISKFESNLTTLNDLLNPKRKMLEKVLGSNSKISNIIDPIRNYISVLKKQKFSKQTENIDTSQIKNTSPNTSSEPLSERARIFKSKMLEKVSLNLRRLNPIDIIRNFISVLKKQKFSKQTDEFSEQTENIDTSQIKNTSPNTSSEPLSERARIFKSKMLEKVSLNLRRLNPIDIIRNFISVLKKQKFSKQTDEFSEQTENIDTSQIKNTSPNTSSEPLSERARIFKSKMLEKVSLNLRRLNPIDIIRNFISVLKKQKFSKQTDEFSEQTDEFSEQTENREVTEQASEFLQNAQNYYNLKELKDKRTFFESFLEYLFLNENIDNMNKSFGVESRDEISDEVSRNQIVTQLLESCKNKQNYSDNEFYTNFTGIFSIDFNRDFVILLNSDKIGYKFKHFLIELYKKRVNGEIEGTKFYGLFLKFLFLNEDDQIKELKLFGEEYNITEEEKKELLDIMAKSSDSIVAFLFGSIEAVFGLKFLNNISNDINIPKVLKNFLINLYVKKINNRAEYNSSEMLIKFIKFMFYFEKITDEEKKEMYELFGIDNIDQITEEKKTIVDYLLSNDNIYSIFFPIRSNFIIRCLNDLSFTKLKQLFEYVVFNFDKTKNRLEYINENNWPLHIFKYLLSGGNTYTQIENFFPSQDDQQNLDINDRYQFLQDLANSFKKFGIDTSSLTDYYSFAYSILINEEVENKIKNFIIKVHILKYGVNNKSQHEIFSNFFQYLILNKNDVEDMNDLFGVESRSDISDSERDIIIEEIFTKLGKFSDRFFPYYAKLFWNCAYGTNSPDKLKTFMHNYLKEKHSYIHSYIFNDMITFFRTGKDNNEGLIRSFFELEDTQNLDDDDKKKIITFISSETDKYPYLDEENLKYFLEVKEEEPNPTQNQDDNQS